MMKQRVIAFTEDHCGHFIEFHQKVRKCLLFFFYIYTFICTFRSASIQLNRKSNFFRKIASLTVVSDEGVINWDTLVIFAYSISSLHSSKTAWRCAVHSQLFNSPPLPHRGVYFFIVAGFTATFPSFLCLPPDQCAAAAVSPQQREVSERCSALGQSGASFKLTQLTSELIC